MKWEAEEKKVCKEEEGCEAECKHKAEAKEKAEAGSSDEASAEVKMVVMDPSCTHCTWAKAVCKFLVDSNKKCITCMQCNQLKEKCWWPRDGKDAEAGLKAGAKVNKGKDQQNFSPLLCSNMVTSSNGLGINGQRVTGSH
ncbi:hypothetical protein F5J12DRAFT_897894 [Pisolithus orientalis]|uniref:uncharacterized protein n=1 Tax=Pisolithus orientalis TaxID=936130 RepID=UPI00222438A7|nr:uncharacterized protein F5J12DRAFT_897894 [Pisolithus orientalis]KAI5989633.1 hypothetical protein F5J12DRAFT_897894 [Pisolithus orientalis]